MIVFLVDASGTATVAEDWLQDHAYQWVMVRTTCADPEAYAGWFVNEFPTTSDLATSTSHVQEFERFLRRAS